MEQANLLCEIDNCGQIAHYFGIRGNQKIRSCKEHFSALPEKGFTVSAIDRYFFVSSLLDIEEFEKRKALADKGRGNLTALLTDCEFGRESALKVIENEKSKVMTSVENRFEEIKVAVTQAFVEENQLPPLAVLLCADLGLTPSFVRFCIADVSDDISAGIHDSWDLAISDILSALKCIDSSQKRAAIKSALQEAERLAEKGIPEALRYANSLIEDDASFDREKGHVIEQLLKFEKKRAQKNLNWLQKSWDLYQRDQGFIGAKIKVGEQLGNLLCDRFGRFSEAEQIFMSCRSIAETPADAMSLKNNICRLYLTTARYQELDLLGMELLSEFEGAHLPAEYYRTTLLYLTYSMKLQFTVSPAIPILERWKHWMLHDENKLAEMLQLMTRGIEGTEEAEKLLLKAMHIGTSHYLTSPFTALCAARLALASEGITREMYHRQAQCLYAVSSSKSTDSARNLDKLGNYFYNMHRLEEAEECYQQASSIYQVAAPKSTDAASNQYSIGLLLHDLNRLREAAKCYQNALSIYEIAAPGSILAARNLHNLGVLHYEMKQWRQAVRYYRKAQAVYTSVASYSTEEADNLSSLGIVLACTNNTDEAEVCYTEAQLRYEHNGARSIQAANNLHNLSDLLKIGNRMKEAEDCYRQAQEIYEVTAPKSKDAADNLYCLGGLYSSTEQWREAEKCYRAAQSRYADSCPQDIQTANNLHDLGTVLKASQQWREAEQCYRQAASIYTAQNSTQAAKNLSSLGHLLQDTKRRSEALECFKRAQQIYQVAAPLSLDSAKNLCTLGEMCTAAKRESEAEKFHLLAQSIYDGIAPESVGAAYNLFHLGVVLEATHEILRAIACFEGAASIYERKGDEGSCTEAERRAAALKQ